MIANLRPYPAYKPSGVQWLGEVPEHWEVKRCLYLFREIDKRSPDGSEQHLSMSQRLGIVPSHYIENRTLVSESYAGGKLCSVGDLVLNRLKAHLGVFALAQQAGVVSPDYTVLRPFAPDGAAYIERVLRSHACRGELRSRAKGIVEGFWRLYTDDLYNIRLPYPPSPEQSAIVRFLDHADRQIRRYTRAKQKLIKLLEEQKQVIIHRAVTRGLDPNVRLKPSGLEWLGDVPEHWSIRRNGSLFWERIERGDPEWPILIVSLRTGVTVGQDMDEDGRPRRLIEDRTSYKKAVKEDITYNMMRMWQGAVGVAPVDGLVSPAYVVAAPRREVDTRFFSLLFRTERYKAEVNRVSTGIVSDRNRLYWDDFKMLPSLVPPFPEQQQIVEAVEAACADMDNTILRLRREIDLIREYRTRLVTDVVTGQVDVREQAAELPEIEEGEPLDDVSLEGEAAVDDDGPEPAEEDAGADD